MSDYKKMYAVLFNKITDIVKELEEVQQMTEEMFMKQNREEPILFANQASHQQEPESIV